MASAQLRDSALASALRAAAPALQRIPALMWHQVSWRAPVRTNQPAGAGRRVGKPCRHAITYQDLLPGLGPVCLLTGSPCPAFPPPHPLLS